ncbi:MAG: ADP-ribosylglycohydrolase family protein [Bacteroidales bacterium]|nr:ADP-ribosylglycohydrolase family protein [Bacteroidales bacterium]
MKRLICLLLFLPFIVSCSSGGESGMPDSVVMTENELLNKIKGGWAGQTIGVVFGAPVEFNFNGSYLQDYQPVPWSEHYVLYWWNKKPGLFDDIYNDCTFVEAFDQLGADCSAEDLAKRFAYADYHLAHANQAARYNIRHGIMPPASGYWKNNPHADDIDFQIESDFIGLMTPAMLPLTLEYAARVGHIMNSGDGFYGGAYVSAMYSCAFYEKDPVSIVKKALSVIPEGSKFHKCISDVISFYDKNPVNWKDCWHFLQDKWNCDVGCPKGVFRNFNIDAKLNSAFVTLALLYGKGDYSVSLDIAARCGQDADCNPSTVGGVLGVMYGYDNIPSFWLDPLKEIENLNFQGTDISLNKAASMSFKQARSLILTSGGFIKDSIITIPIKKAAVLPLEQNFEGMYPLFREKEDTFLTDEFDFNFSGNGFVIWGNLCCTRNISLKYINKAASKHLGSEVFSMAEPGDPYIARVMVTIDGRQDGISKMPMNGTDRKLEPAYKYLLPEGRHHVVLKWLNPNKDYAIRIDDIMFYSANKNNDKFYYNNKKVK